MGKSKPTPSDAELWEKSKVRAMREAKKSRGAEKWDARIAQRASKLYKEAGGKWTGGAKKDSSLTKWTKEDWTYWTDKRGKSGRYLPRAVWKKLPEKMRQAENDKRLAEGFNAPYLPKTAKIMRDLGIV